MIYAMILVVLKMALRAGSLRLKAQHLEPRMTSTHAHIETKFPGPRFSGAIHGLGSGEISQG